MFKIKTSSIVSNIYSQVFAIVFHFTPLSFIDLCFDFKGCKKLTTEKMRNSWSDMYIPLGLIANMLYLFYLLVSIITFVVYYKIDVKNNNPIEIVYDLNTKTPISLNVYEYNERCYDYRNHLKSGGSTLTYILDLSVVFGKDLICTHEDADHKTIELNSYMSKLSAQELSSYLSTIDARSLLDPSFGVKEGLPQPTF